MSVGRMLVIGIVVVGLICVGCVALGGLGIFGLLQATQPVVDASEDWLEAIKAGNYADAYGMMAPSLQTEVGSAEDLQAMFTNRTPDSWSITSRSIENNTGSAGGTMTAADGTEYNMTINLQKSGDDWQIVGFDFQPR